MDKFISPAGLAGYMSSVVKPRLDRDAKGRFRSKGDGASGKWAPLAQATQDIRQNLGFSPNDINVRTGTLRDFVTNSSPVISQDLIGTTMEWPGNPGSNLGRRLAQAAGRGKGPARYVIAYDMNTVAYILSTLETWTVKGKGR